MKEYFDKIEKAQESTPVDVIQLAKDCGLKVFKVANWPDDLSGLIKKGETGQYEIYFNADHSEQRQRFTVAHELAHFILHRPLIGDGLVDDAMYRSGLSNGVESEANALAADILMPRALVMELRKKPEHTAYTLAEKFNVSQSAMDIRLGVPSS